MINLLKKKQVKECTKTSYSKGLVSGVHPPDVESQILIIMKDIALAKSQEGLWKESYSILKNISSCEKELFGHYHPQVANTLYHSGVVLGLLGDTRGALSAFQEGIHILNPRRKKDKNSDLAALYYQCGVIKGREGNHEKALYK